MESPMHDMQYGAKYVHRPLMYLIVLSWAEKVHKIKTHKTGEGSWLN